MTSGFDAIFSTMDSMNAELSVITARLNALEQGGASAGGKGSEEGAATGAPVVWARLEGEELAAQWELFVDWVFWAADTFELTPEQLPRQCWWRHGAAIEELTALWTAYRSAYEATEDAGSATYLWVDALARSVERLNRVWLSSCTAGFHDPKTRTAFAGDEPYRATVLQAPGGAAPQEGEEGASSAPTP